MSDAAINLVRDEIRDGSRRLTRVPRWARPLDGEGYWHIPRSAEIVDASLSWGGKRASDDVLCARFWCGQMRWLKRDALVAEPFVGALRCGTCEGRALGYEQRDGLIFAPRSPFDAPRLCPAFLSAGEERCPFCGSKGSFRRGYCYYDQAQHRPADGLVRATPCPRHGWKYARRQSTGLVCLGAFAWLDSSKCAFEIMREVSR